MVTMAPPGWECHPEEPPMTKTFLATTTSVPSRKTSVPSDWSVPLATTALVKPSGAVARPGMAKTVANTTAAPRTVAARINPRPAGLFMCAFFHSDSFGRERRKGKEGRGWATNRNFTIVLAQLGSGSRFADARRAAKPAPPPRGPTCVVDAEEAKASGRPNGVHPPRKDGVRTLTPACLKSIVIRRPP